MHVTHCMLHHNTYIDVLVSNILLFVLFASALTESGQVIPLYIAHADDMKDFGTALLCLYVTNSMLHIDCYT